MPADSADPSPEPEVDPDDELAAAADPLADDPLLEADPVDVLDQRLPARPTGPGGVEDRLARDPLIEADPADLADQAAAIPYEDDGPAAS
jgi:hypothetical protein